MPRIESYFRRCASVDGSVMSLTATICRSRRPRAARKTLRPMRPNPLMPTFTGMTPLLALGGFPSSGLRDVPHVIYSTISIRISHQAAKAIGDRRLTHLGELREFAQAGARVRQAEFGHLAQRS